MRALYLAGLLFLAQGISAESRLTPPSPTRWAIDGGYGLRLWETSPGITAKRRQYENHAKQGLAVGAEITAFPWESLGLGILYTQFYSSVSAHGITGTEGAESSKDTYLIRYAGPSLSYKWNAGALDGIAQAGAGYFLYWNNHQDGDFPGIIESQVPGVQAGFSLDYRVFRHAGIGVGARAMHGLVKRVDYSGIPISLAELREKDISLTRVDVTVGLRFYP